MKGNPNHTEEVRIGVFICDCGSNIAGHLDCKELTRFAATLPNVICAEENLYTCSESGITEIQRAIREYRLNRVLVASCSPRTHQGLFQSSCASSGLNPYLFEMANIRDQCSWVHMQESENATDKAKDLVRMAAARATFLTPENDIETPLLPRAAVIGGGVAGLSAATVMADMGLSVVLIEKTETLGGLLTRLHRLAPDGTLAAEMLAPLITKTMASKNIRTYLQSEVQNVGGYIGNYTMVIRGPSGEKQEEKIGAIVVATGAVPLLPEGISGYDGQRVLTQMELEQRLADGNTVSGRIVMIQCVGARNSERPYCSRICCRTAVKNALHIMEADPASEVHILYRDMQMYGIENERLLWEARGHGVRFDVYDSDRLPVVGDKSVSFDLPLTGEKREIPYDRVVLSTPLIAREDAEALARLLRIPLDRNQFFLEAHAKLRPLDFAADGLFLCGSARYPSTVTEACTQAIGAASRVASILFKDVRITSGIVAEINPDTCAGCKGCVEVCPYGAIEYLEEKDICRINTMLCKGCGSCAAACPSHSAVLKGFRPSQIAAQIRAV